jgi:hypothetical protein
MLMIRSNKDTRYQSKRGLKQKIRYEKISASTYQTLGCVQEGSREDPNKRIIPVPPSPTMTSLKLGQLSGVTCPGKAFREK